MKKNKQLLGATLATAATAGIMLTTANGVAAATTDDTTTATDAASQQTTTKTDAQQLADAKAVQKTAQTANDAATTQVKNIQGQLDQQQDALDTANDDVKSAQKTVDTAKTTVDAAQKAADVSTTEIDQAKSDLAIAKTDASTAKDTAEAAATAVKTATSNQTQAETDAKSASDAVTTQQDTVDTAQKAVDAATKAATGTTTSNTDVTAAQRAVDADTKAVASAQEAVDSVDSKLASAQNAVDTAADAYVKANQLDIPTPEEIAAAKQEVAEIWAKIDALQAQQDAAKKDFASEVAKANGQNRIILPANSLDNDGGLNPDALSNGKFKDYVPSAADKAQKVKDFTHMTLAERTELSEFVGQLFNDILGQAGSDFDIVNEQSIDVAQQVADAYNDDDWTLGGTSEGSSAHDLDGLDRVAAANNIEYGIAENAASGGWISDPTTMAGIKSGVFDVINAMMFDDDASDWGHAANILTGESYVGCSIDELGQIHFDFYSLDPTGDQGYSVEGNYTDTELKNLKTIESTSVQIRQLEYSVESPTSIAEPWYEGYFFLEDTPESLKLQDAISKLNDAKAKYNVDDLNTALKTAQSKLINDTNTLNAAKEAVAASQKTTDEQNATITKAQDALNAAQKTLSNLQAEAKSKQEAVTTAQNALKDAQDAKTSADEAVTAANAKVSDLEKQVAGYTDAPKKLADAQEALTKAQTALAEAKSKVSPLAQQVTASELALKLAKELQSSTQTKLNAAKSATSTIQKRIDAAKAVEEAANKAEAQAKVDAAKKAKAAAAAKVKADATKRAKANAGKKNGSNSGVSASRLSSKFTSNKTRTISATVNAGAKKATPLASGIAGSQAAYPQTGNEANGAMTLFGSAALALVALFGGAGVIGRKKNA